jgi:hypothetical protein
MTFSVDFQGPTALGPGPFSGTPDFFGGVPIDEGQILTPGRFGPPGPNIPLPGPLPTPGVMVTSVPSAFGTIPGGLGVFPGVFGGVEVDALSYGRDLGQVLYFSVDEWASGDPNFMPALPNLLTEGTLGAAESSADVLRYLGPMPMGPFFPPAPPPLPGPGNLTFYDGEGTTPSSPLGGPFGIGLIEPNPPGPGPDAGDNLDALDMLSTFNDVAGRIYFSLDAQFPDPLEAFFPPINSGTAIGNGFSGADILLTTPGAAPFLFAPAPILGLDLLGFDTDDLDALAIADVGIIGTYEPAIDSVLFSVRRGSAIIGTPDSVTGIPIEEGDILTRPPALGLPPAIVMPAEMMGLATRRSGTVTGPGFPFADDVDALDVTRQNNGDFNLDGVYSCADVDALVVAIVFGGSLSFDITGDGIIDQLDLATWLVEAGANNLGAGKIYLPADANLDGVVDGADFVIWNANKFTAMPAFCSGDFNADGSVDGADFVIWNAFKFMSWDGVNHAPEPNGCLVIIALAAWLAASRRRR